MARIIEARALLTAKDEASQKILAMAKQVDRIAKAQSQASRAGIAQTAKMAGEVERLTTRLGNIEGFRRMSRELNSTSVAWRRAQQDADRAKRAMEAAGGAGGRLARDYERAARGADRARQAFMAQGRAVREARQGLETAGVPIANLAARQRELQVRLDAATAAMKRQDAAAATLKARPWGDPARSGSGVPLVPRQVPQYAQNAPPPPAHPVSPRPGLMSHLPATVGSGYGAYRGAQMGKTAIQKAGEFDYAVRRQRAYADITEQEQSDILIPQAIRIGVDTPFTNKDIVEAQTTVASRLPADLKNARTIAPLVGQMKNYALAMKGTTMEDAAQAVTGFLLSTGKDLSSPEKADAESRRASNLLLRAGKLGAMSHHDLMPLVQRGLSAGRIAGLSDETMLALGVGMKRSNISGDQAGTALRTLSSKLVAPTNKGMAALATAGIDYNQFTRMPGGLSVDNLEGKFRQDFGKSFTPEVREQLSEVLSDTEIVADRGRFTQAVTEAVAGLFKPKKDGTMAAADRKAVAKKVGEFHRFSAERVDSEGLLQAILSKDPTLGVLNAFATDKHGAKIGLIARAFEQFERDRQVMKETPADFGDKISATITSGLGGAIERLVGSIDTAFTQVGRANENWLAPSLDKIGNTIESLAMAPPKIVEFTTQVGLAAGALLALRSAAGIASVAAGAATAAGVTGGGVSALASAGATGATIARMGFMGLGYGALATGGYYLVNSTIGEANRKLYEGVAPGEVHNEGRNRRRRYHDALRAQTEGVRQGVAAEDAAPPARAPVFASGAPSVRFNPPSPSAPAKPPEPSSSWLPDWIAKSLSRQPPPDRVTPATAGDFERKLPDSLKVGGPVEVTGKVETSWPGEPLRFDPSTLTVNPDALRDLRAVVDAPVPVDVSGKLDPVEIKWQAKVDVKVTGPAQVTGISQSSSGHVKADAGTAMVGTPGYP